MHITKPSLQQFKNAMQLIAHAPEKLGEKLARNFQKLCPRQHCADYKSLRSLKDLPSIPSSESLRSLKDLPSIPSSESLLQNYKE